MVEEERIKRVSKLRTILKTRIEEIEKELSGLNAILEFIDKTLVEEGFKKAELIPGVNSKREKENSKISRYKTEKENYIPLRAATGENLAEMFVQEKILIIKPIEKLKLTIDIPPFSSFLVDRVLEKMRKKDMELVNRSRLIPEQMFSYEIIRDDGLIQEIIIRNANPDRVRELKSATRWTFEKMWQKRKLKNK